MKPDELQEFGGEIYSCMVQSKLPHSSLRMDQ